MTGPWRGAARAVGHLYAPARSAGRCPAAQPHNPPCWTGPGRPRIRRPARRVYAPTDRQTPASSLIPGHPSTLFAARPFLWPEANNSAANATTPGEICALRPCRPCRPCGPALTPAERRAASTLATCVAPSRTHDVGVTRVKVERRRGRRGGHGAERTAGAATSADVTATWTATCTACLRAHQSPYACTAAAWTDGAVSVTAPASLQLRYQPLQKWSTHTATKRGLPWRPAGRGL